MKRKIFVALSVLLMLSLGLILAACGEQASADKNGEADPVQDLVSEVVEQNSNVEIGDYTQPSEDLFEVEERESGVAITGFTGEQSAVIIPDNIGGKPVVAIAKNAFGNSKIRGVKLPNSVTEIDDSAFYYCVSLNEIEFGEAVVSVGEKAFEGCSVLSEVVLNNKLVKISDKAFGFCSMLKRIVLPNSLTEIGVGAFALSGIEEITIPGSIQTISKQAFSTCQNLKSVNISEGVTVIDTKAFESCKSLKEVVIPASVTSILNNAFNSCHDLSIIAPSGSYAESYANDNGIPFTAK